MSSQNEKGQETVQEQKVESKDSKAQDEGQKEQQEPSAQDDDSREEPEKAPQKPRMGLGYCHEWGNPFNMPGF